MRSLFCVSTLALLVLFTTGGATAGSKVPATSVDSAASEPVTYVNVHLGFERVMAKLDREVDLQLLPTTMDCANGADGSGAEVCVVRLSPAFPASAPASLANP
jgi:hypothetical protein